jgi:hypothetical protein
MALARTKRGTAKNVDPVLQLGGFSGRQAVVAIVRVKPADRFALAKKAAGFAAGNQAGVALAPDAAIELKQLSEQLAILLRIAVRRQSVAGSKPLTPQRFFPAAAAASDPRNGRLRGGRNGGGDSEQKEWKLARGTAPVREESCIPATPGKLLRR